MFVVISAQRVKAGLKAVVFFQLLCRMIRFKNPGLRLQLPLRLQQGFKDSQQFFKNRFLFIRKGNLFQISDLDRCRNSSGSLIQ